MSFQGQLEGGMWWVGWDCFPANTGWCHSGGHISISIGTSGESAWCQGITLVSGCHGQILLCSCLCSAWGEASRTLGPCPAPGHSNGVASAWRRAKGQQHLAQSAQVALVGWSGGRGREGPAMSPFNLASSLAESLRRGAPPQVEETQPLCLHTPLAERY